MSVRRYSTRTLCRDPGGDRLYGGSVDSSRHGCLTWTLYRGTRWGLSVLGSGRLVGTWVYDPNSSSRYPTRVRPTRRYTDTGLGLFVRAPGGSRLCMGPVDSTTYWYRVQTLCRDTPQGWFVRRSGRLLDTQTYGPDFLSGYPVRSIRVQDRTVRLNVDTGSGLLFVGASGEIRLHGDPVGTS